MTTIEPFSRLGLLLAIDRAQRANLHRFAAALVAIYRKEYPSK